MQRKIGASSLIEETYGGPAQAAAAPGAPLADDVRAPMEQAFSADFSAVRVHQGQYVADMGARAYAQGADLHFAPGQLDPHSRGGRELIGHELGHVVQQAEGRVAPGPQRKGAINEDSALEREADDLGARAAAGEVVRRGHVSASGLSATGAAIQGVFVRAKGGIFRDNETGDLYDLVADTGTGRILVCRRSDQHRLWIRENGTQGQWDPIDDDEAARNHRLNAKPPSSPASSDESGPPPTQVSPSARLPVSDKRDAPTMSMITNFTVQVTAAPIAQGRAVRTDDVDDMHYTAQQVWVESIRIGNQDRPDTRHGAKQERHTVAWTLERAAQIAQSGQTAQAVLLFYIEDLRRMAAVLQTEPALRLMHQVLVAAEPLLNGSMPIDRWQAVLSYVATIYTQAYQASQAATFKGGRPVGHGEAPAMEKLREAEEAVGAKQSIDLDQVATNAATLLDVQFNMSLGEGGYATAVRHWIERLTQAFPQLMAAHGDELVGPVLRRSVAAGVLRRTGAKNVAELLDKVGPAAASVHAGGTRGKSAAISNSSAAEIIEVPRELDVDFVANVEMTPLATGELDTTTAQIEGGPEVRIQQPYYTPDQLAVRRIHLSDRDRPDTKFDGAQMSHTVAWTLVRADLMAFAGQPIDAMMIEIGKRLVRHIADLKNPLALRLAMLTLAQVTELRDTSMAIYRWQAAISDIVRRYTIVYQKVGSASFADDSTLGHAQGHGEGSHMQRLFANERALAENQKLCDDQDAVVKSALALIDVRINGTLTAQQYVSAILEWNQMINRVFPRTGEVIAADLNKGIAARPLPPEVMKTFDVKNPLELIGKLKGRVEATATLFDYLRGVHFSKGKRGDPRALVEPLGFQFHQMPGDGNDCAIASIYHQLRVVHNLNVGDYAPFALHVRTHANLAMGTMIDLVANGAAVLAAVQGYLDAHVPAALAGGLVLDVWSATEDENGIMEYQSVATLAGVGARVMRLFFNGVNHFDSLTGGPPRG